MIDLSPIQLKAIPYRGGKLRFEHQTVLNPDLDEDTSQLYVIEDVSLSLHVFAQTRDQLIQEITEQIVFMWDAYVVEPEDKLAPDAIRLRRRLLGLITEEKAV